MNQQLILFIAGTGSLLIGTVAGYYLRQSMVRRRAGTIESSLQRKIFQAKKEADAILLKAKSRAERIEERSQKEIEQRRSELIGSEHLLLKREEGLVEEKKGLDGK